MLSSFKIDLRGVNEIEKGDAIKSVLAGKAQEIASRASSMAGGASFEVEESDGRYMAFANVHPRDAEAVGAVLRDNVILKAMGGGR